MIENRMDGLEEAEEKVVADTHPKPAEKPQEADHATLDAEDKVVDPKPVEAKPEAPVANVVCPKCEKRNVLVNDEGAYCTACGSLGSAKDVAGIIADKKDAEKKLNIEHNMPPLPKKRDFTDTTPDISDYEWSLLRKQEEIIDYITWLGKHWRRESLFVCSCGKTYSPVKDKCPNCNPTGSLAIKR